MTFSFRLCKYFTVPRKMLLCMTYGRVPPYRTWLIRNFIQSQVNNLLFHWRFLKMALFVTIFFRSDRQTVQLGTYTIPNVFTFISISPLIAYNLWNVSRVAKLRHEISSLLAVSTNFWTLRRAHASQLYKVSCEIHNYTMMDWISR